MNFNSIFDLYIAAEGIFMTVTGNSFFASMSGRYGVMSKYSAESRKKFCRLQGPILIVVSAIMFAMRNGMLPASLSSSVVKWSLIGGAAALSLLNAKLNLKKGSPSSCGGTYIDED